MTERLNFQCSFCQGVISVEFKEAEAPVVCEHCAQVLHAPSCYQSGSLIGDFILEKELDKEDGCRVFHAYQMSLARATEVKILENPSTKKIRDFLDSARDSNAITYGNIMGCYYFARLPLEVRLINLIKDLDQAPKLSDNSLELISRLRRVLNRF